LPGAPDNTRHLRSHSFLIAWTRADTATAGLDVASPAEYIMVLPDAGAEITWKDGKLTAPGRSVCIVPEGRTSVRLLDGGQCLRFFSPVPAALANIDVFAKDRGSAAMPPLRPHEPAYRRVKATGEPVVHEVESYPNSAGMPRAKLFQSATMSINWVEYQGPRDRTKLSPHSHTHIEQASIAVEGDFVHHYRTIWTPNADIWREDEHLPSGPDSITLIPPPINPYRRGHGSGATYPD
jgi:hypothetical protein